MFRGAAILQIVVLHAGRALFNRGYAEPIADSDLAFATIDIFFHNATIYFTLISSILYARIFAHRDFVGFLKGRALYVATPYLVVSTALTILMSFRQGGDLGQLPAAIFLAGATGDAWNQLWYIPVILALYALTPTMFALARAPEARWAAVALIAAPLLFSRTGTDVTAPQLLYFAGPYMLGLLIGLDLERWMDAFERRKAALGATALASTAALYALYIGGLDYVGPVSARESLYYVQKLALAALLLTLMRRWSLTPRRRRDAFLTYAATTAFGIYFVHAPALRPIVRVVGGLTTEPPGGAERLALTFVAAVAAVLVSWAVVIVAQKTLGRRSRLILGA
ncbi:MAG: acyltransferase [Parvularculaceae bacterium]